MKCFSETLCKIPLWLLGASFPNQQQLQSASIYVQSAFIYVIKIHKHMFVCPLQFTFILENACLINLSLWTCICSWAVNRISDLATSPGHQWEVVQSPAWASFPSCHLSLPSAQHPRTCGPSPGISWQGWALSGGVGWLSGSQVAPTAWREGLGAMKMERFLGCCLHTRI